MKTIPACVITILQTLAFVILHDFVFSWLFETRKIGLLSWGISLQIALFEFIVVCLITNLLLEYVPKLSRYLVILLAITLFSLFWIRHLVDAPTLTLKLLGHQQLVFSRIFRFVGGSILL